MQTDMFGWLGNTENMAASKNCQMLKTNIQKTSNCENETGQGEFSQIFNQLKEEIGPNISKKEQIKQTVEKFFEGEKGQSLLSELSELINLTDNTVEQADSHDDLGALAFIFQAIFENDLDLKKALQDSAVIENEILKKVSDDSGELNADILKKIEKILFSAASDKGFNAKSVNDNGFSIKDFLAVNITEDTAKQSPDILTKNERVIDGSNAKNQQVELPKQLVDVAERSSDTQEDLNQVKELIKDLKKNQNEEQPTAFEKKEKASLQDKLKENKDILATSHLDGKKDSSIKSDLSENVKFSGEIKGGEEKIELLKKVNPLKDSSDLNDRNELKNDNSEGDLSKTSLGSKNSMEIFDLDGNDEVAEKINTAKGVSNLADTKTTTRIQEPRQAEIIRQIVENVKLSGKKDNNEITIKLKPEVLGNIKLNISTDHHHVTIRVIADSSVVKDILENNLHHLKTGFVNQGLEIGSFDVLVGDDSNDLYRGQQFSGFNRGRKQMGGQKKNGWALGEEENEKVSESTTSKNMTKERIDYYV